MTFAAALRAYLMADPAVAGFVAGRIYPVIVPAPGEGQTWTGDALSYSLIASSPSDGLNASREARREWEIAAVADDYERTHEIAEAVEAALDYFSGTMGGAGGVQVLSCRRASMSDAEDFELGLFAVVQTYDVRYLKPQS